MPSGPPNPLADAWHEALRARGDAWWAYAMHLTKNEPDAEDLVQTMLTSMLVRQISPDDVAPAYPFRVLRNAHATRLRRQRTERAHAPRIATDRDEARVDAELARALDTLTEDQREVITLKHAGGLTLEQIAAATGRPLGTVAGTHRRAILALRERLATEEETSR